MSYVIAVFSIETKEELYVSTSSASTTLLAKKVQRFEKFEQAERWLHLFENSSIRYFSDVIPNLRGFGAV